MNTNSSYSIYGTKVLQILASFSLLFICLLAFSMATNTKWNTHPDEFAHFEAASYYKLNFLPPEPCDEDILMSYSSYGYSRLDKDDISYFFIGKFMLVTDVLPASDLAKARYFNIFLLFIIALLSLRHLNGMLLALPILIFPQVWYLFSYVNSEAFAIFISYIIFYQIFVPSTLVRNYLFSPTNQWLKSGLLLAVILLCCFILVKKSFYFVLLFALGLLIISIVFKKFKLSAIPRILLIMVLGFSAVYALKYIHHPSNEEHNQQVLQCAVKLADAAYQPDTALKDTKPNMYLKEKGIPLDYLFDSEKIDWVNSMWKSSVGHFGYVKYEAPQWYYQLMLILFVIILCAIIYSIIVADSWYLFIVLLGVVTTFSMNVFISIWLSWTYDLQTQGRYLFSIISMLGVIFCLSRKHLPIKLVTIVVFCMLSLGIYQFINTGLIAIPKY